MFGRKLWVPLLAIVTFTSTVTSTPTADSSIEERAVTYTPVSFKTIYVPPRNYNTPKTLYGRTVQLPDGTLLATWYDNLSSQNQPSTKHLSQGELLPRTTPRLLPYPPQPRRRHYLEPPLQHNRHSKQLGSPLPTLPLRPPNCNRIPPGGNAPRLRRLDPYRS